MPLFLTYRLYKVYLGRMDDERRHVRELSDMHLATVEALAMAIEAKDATAGSHVRRVQYYATELGRALGLRDDLIEGVRIAALLHDVGKLGVPDHLLAKSGPLTPEEFARVCRYPEIGAEIVSAVPFPYPVAPFIRHHHERWDGTGYPDMIAGDLIPLGARIIAIAERFDALRSERPYRPPLSLAEASRTSGTRPARASTRTWSRSSSRSCPPSRRRPATAIGATAVLDNISEAQGELYELFERAHAPNRTPTPLTDLPNRRFVETHMARELARAQRSGSGLAVLAIDLNDFKVINDRLGHGAGDIVLEGRGAVPAAGLAAARHLRPPRWRRVRGRAVRGRRRRLRTARASSWRRPSSSLAIDVGSREPLRVSVSIGAAVYPADGVTLDDLFAAADVRMYENKLRLRALESGHLVVQSPGHRLIIFKTNAIDQR